MWRALPYACVAVTLATTGCIEDFATPAVDDCGEAVRGTSSQWTARGELRGYTTAAGCGDIAVIVVGQGTRLAGDVLPTAPVAERGVAITALFHQLIEPWRYEIDSWVGYTYGTTCLDEGMFGVIEVYDWRDVDHVIGLLGPALADGGYGERVGIALRRLPCAEPL